MSFIKFLLACEPWLFVWGMLFFFKAKGWLHPEWSSWNKLLTLFAVTLLWIPAWWMGYRYESMLLGETLPSAVIGWPYIKRYFFRSAVFVVIIPLLLGAWLAQIISVRFDEWLYPPDAGLFFLGWFRDAKDAGVLGYTMWFGAPMPKAEMLWYGLYMLKVLGEFCIILFVTPDKFWEAPRNALKRLWLGVYGAGLLFLLIMVAWFALRNGRLPGIACLVTGNFAMMLTAAALSRRARDFMGTPIYAVVTCVMTVQYAFWEFVHSPVLHQWRYDRENQIGSLLPIFEHFRYPAIPGVSEPWYFPPEEFLGYLTVYPATFMLIFLFNKIRGINLLKPGEFRARVEGSNRSMPPAAVADPFS